MSDASENVEPVAPRGPRRKLIRPPSRAVTLVLAALGTVALALGMYFGYIALFGEDEAAEAERPVVPTHTVEPRKGGFSVTAPTSMDVERSARSVYLSTPTKDLVITVGPSGGGSLKASDGRILTSLRTEYRKVRLVSSERIEVNGRTALTTGGQAVNRKGVKLRFVLVTLPAKKVNYSVTAFTAFDSDPAVVLPLVNTVVEGFEPMPRRAK